MKVGPNHCKDTLACILTNTGRVHKATRTFLLRISDPCRWQWRPATWHRWGTGGKAGTVVHSASDLCRRRKNHWGLGESQPTQQWPGRSDDWKRAGHIRRIRRQVWRLHRMEQATKLRMSCKNKEIGPYASSELGLYLGYASKDHTSPWEDSTCILEHSVSTGTASSDHACLWKISINKCYFSHGKKPSGGLVFGHEVGLCELSNQDPPVLILRYSCFSKV